MSKISSINFKKSNPIQTRHNDRDLPPSYLIGGENEVNRNHKEALAFRNKIVAKAMQDYTKHTGQKFQAKSYEWSAVVNLKPESTMEDLEELTEHFSQKYGFQCYQIAIHRDEGHINERGEKIINHHAHLEFITLDKETGKNNYNRQKISPSVLRQMQSEVAKILQMERGQDKRLTGAKRIEPRTYAKMKEEERKNSLELKKSLEIEKAKAISKTWENAEQNFLSVKEIKDTLEAFRKQSIGKGFSKEFFRELSDKKKNTKEATKEELELFCSDLLRAYEIKDKELQEVKTKQTEPTTQDKQEQGQQSENEKLLQRLEKMHYYKMPKTDFDELENLYNTNYNELQKKGIDYHFKSRYFAEARETSERNLYTLKNGDYLIYFLKEITKEKYQKSKINTFRDDLSHEKQKNEELLAKTKEIDLKASYELLNDNFQKLQKENEDLKRKKPLLRKNN